MLPSISGRGWGWVFMLLYIGLGSNLGDRAENIRQAVRLIGERVGTLVKCSSIYESAPVDMKTDNMFYNAAAIFDTDRDPHEILELTQEIERELGRTLKSDGRHYDRTIDIDLLQYGDYNFETASLTLPHPMVPSRQFVLEPLAEIAPDVEFMAAPFDTFTQMLQDLDTAEITVPTEALATDWRGVNFLLDQLSPGKSISWQDYQDMIANPTVHMVFLSDYVGDVKRRVGMATLCVTQSPTGRKGWIEDVVVDKPFRGRGLSHRLIACMKTKAVEVGVTRLMLTSRPQRVAANRLYQHEGFSQKETNVYTFDVNPDDVAAYRRDVEEQHLKRVQ